MGTVHEYQHIIMIISRSVLLRMENDLENSSRENQNTLFMFKSVLFFKNRAVYEIMWIIL